MNTVNLIGNISTDINVRYTASGKCVATFNLAMNHPYNREKTVFLPIEVWGKTAENVSNYCSKGTKIAVVGHIDVDEWEKDGQKRSKTKITAHIVEFLTPKGKGTGEQKERNTGQKQAPASVYGVADPLTGENSGYADPFADSSIPIDDSDLPF
jgi:single-strand DNA-binding protein